MDHETTNYQTNHQFRRLPKGERRVRFADSMGMELVTIFLIDLINNYYFASIHHKHHAINNTSSSSSSNTNLNNNNNNTAKPSIQQASITKTNMNTICKNYNHHQSTNNHRTSTTSPTPTYNHNYNYYSSSYNNHYNYNYNYNNNNNVAASTKTATAAAAASAKTNSTIAAATTTTSTITNTTNSNSGAANNSTNFPHYVCEFTQPISLISFKERVKLNQIMLETCNINSIAGNTSISCTIRVLNKSYDKSVIVRYTTDEWHTYTDSLASYKPGSCDGWSDKFTSTFSVTNQVKQFHTGQRIMFAVRITYEADKVYWDNNAGLNYTIKKV